MQNFQNLFLGPQTWHKEFPVAEEGKRQSPINIVTDDVVDATADVNKNPLKWTYTDKHCLSVENTGSSWRVNIDGSGSSKFSLKKKMMQVSVQIRGLLLISDSPLKL